jgi:beta-lactamase superfamily II metal-dependent hydrolase
VGSGDSVLLVARDTTVLIDGSSRPYQLLERLGSALPYGARSLGAILVTNPRAGNVAGLREVLKHYRVGEVLDVGVEYPSATYTGWRSDLRRLRIPAYRLQAGTRIDAGDASISALAPAAVRPAPLDSVGILRIRIGGATVLYAGEASRKEQLEEAFLPVRLRADALILWGKACDPVFAKHVAPRWEYGTACPGFQVHGQLKEGETLVAAR